MAKGTSEQKNRSTRIGFYSIVLGIFWTCTACVSLVWNLHLQEQETREVALNVARAYLQSDNIYRRWNALQGGVYIPADKNGPPDLTKSVIEKEIVTPTGKRLVLTPHAMMMDEVYKLAGEDHPARGELSSLESENTIGILGTWKADALKSLISGKKEIGEILSVNGERTFLLMQPYVVEEPCFKCHVLDGREVGDVFGGISVRIPLSKFGIANQQQVRILIWGHLLWWVLGVLGIIISYTGMRTRILERQKVEADLNRLKEQQEKILYAAGEGIYGVDKEGITTFVNPAAVKMLGWKPEELIGRSLHCTIHHSKTDGTVYPEEECPILASLGDGRIYHGTEEVYFRKDGSTFPVDYISTPIVEDGEIKGGVVTFADISERKKAEEEIARARQFLQNIINAMPSILIGIDLDGRVTLLNSEAAKITGFDPENAYGRQLEEVCPMLADKVDQIKSTVNKRQVARYERVYCFPQEGAGRYTDIIIYPLSLEDFQGAVIRIDDVTERVLMEDRLVQSEKMTSVVGLVEGMAHEINNPLGGIIQGVQNVMRRLSSELEQNLRTAAEIGIDLEKVNKYMDNRQIPKFLEGIRSSGKRAADIVSYMLQFSQVHQAPKELRNMGKLLDSLLETILSDEDYRKKYGFDAIEIIKEYDTTLPDVPCITSEIEQVIRNLFRNAAQAINAGHSPSESSRIIIRTKHEQTRNMALIEVEDNGVGMDETVQRRVFEPFFTTKPPGEGTGLGLAVSYFLITVAHQGMMHVESEPGKGTKFSLRIPLSL